MADRPYHLFTLADDSENALRERAGRIAAFIDVTQPSCAGLCAASHAKTNGSHRVALVVEDTAALLDTLRGVSNGETTVATADSPKVAWLFTGQGAQMPGMGRQLYETDATFRAAMDRCDAALRDTLGQPLLSVIYPEDDNKLIHETAYTQPSLFALEVSLAELWQSWGAAPDLMLGHSVGEYAAACVAGAFSLEDGLKLIAERGRLIQSLPAGGEMAAVFADRDTVEAAVAPCADELSVAAHNGPNLNVVSGMADAMTKVLDELSEAGVRAKRMTVSHAFHSPQMDAILDEFHAFASRIEFRPLERPIVSNRDGSVTPAGTVLDADYWRDHIRSAVAFQGGMETLVAEGCTVFLELGPANTLVGMGRRCVELDGGVWPISLDKRGDDWKTLLTAAGDLFTEGAPIELSALAEDAATIQLP